MARKPAPKNQTTSAPVAQATRRTQGRPQIQYGPAGGCRVRHSERVANAQLAPGFTADKYALNPGLVTTFPWLAGVASRFEMYRFHSVRFEYRTKTATSTVGNIMLTCDYDALDSPPTTGVQAESYRGTVSAAPWQNATLVLTAQELHRRSPKYVRTGPPPPTADLKTYDTGNLYFCTEDAAAPALGGYLYIHYDVELMTPHLGPEAQIIGGALITAKPTDESPNGQIIALNPAWSSPWDDGDEFPITFDIQDSPLVQLGLDNTLIIQPGTYLFNSYTVAQSKNQSALNLNPINFRLNLFEGSMEYHKIGSIQYEVIGVGFGQWAEMGEIAYLKVTTKDTKVGPEWNQDSHTPGEEWAWETIPGMETLPPMVNVYIAMLPEGFSPTVLPQNRIPALRPARQPRNHRAVAKELPPAAPCSCPASTHLCREVHR